VTRAKYQTIAVVILAVTIVVIALAWLPMISSAVPHPAWIFISTDEARGTNPRAFPDIAPVLASQ
jgi:hypothetical protein